MDTGNGYCKKLILNFSCSVGEHLSKKGLSDIKGGVGGFIGG